MNSAIQKNQSVQGKMLQAVVTSHSSGNIAVYPGIDIGGDVFTVDFDEKSRELTIKSFKNEFAPVGRQTHIIAPTRAAKPNSLTRYPHFVISKKYTGDIKYGIRNRKLVTLSLLYNLAGGCEIKLILPKGIVEEAPKAAEIVHFPTENVSQDPTPIPVQTPSLSLCVSDEITLAELKSYGEVFVNINGKMLPIK